MGLEESLEGVKDLDEGEKDPEETEKVARTGACKKPGLAWPGLAGLPQNDRERRGWTYSKCKLSVVVVVANM